MTLRNTLGFSALTLSLAITAGCGSSSSSPISSGKDSSAYNGPGSKWDVELFVDNTFTIERSDSPADPVTTEIEGSYTRFDSGFIGLTVEAATGVDAPSPGDEAWALEVPGYALLLKPVDGDQLIPMVSAGRCPTSSFDANWVMVKQRVGADATDSDQDYFGAFSYDRPTATAELPQKRALSTGFPLVTGDTSLGGNSCSNGLMLVGDAPDIAAMYLTNKGGAIVQTNINDEDDAQFILALAQNEIGSIDQLDGDYAGMLFDETNPDDNKIAPVAMSCNTGVCTGTMVTDIETGTTSSDTVTITLTGPDALIEGFITGTIADSSDTGNLACMADIDASGTNKTIVSCVGQAPGDNSAMFNVIFVSL